MRYRFVFTAWFDRDLKSLRKHNPGLRSDFESFLQTKVRKESLSPAEEEHIRQLVAAIQRG